jgi:hypothetical protein
MEAAEEAAISVAGWNYQHKGKTGSSRAMLWCIGKEVLQKESGRRLCYIHIEPLFIHGAFSVISGASSVKIWHPPKTDREKGSEEGRGRGNE